MGPVVTVTVVVVVGTAVVVVVHGLRLHATISYKSGQPPFAGSCTMYRYRKRKPPPQGWVQFHVVGAFTNPC